MISNWETTGFLVKVALLKLKHEVRTSLDKKNCWLGLEGGVGVISCNNYYQVELHKLTDILVVLTHDNFRGFSLAAAKWRWKNTGCMEKARQK
jgi:hypothetical protein